MMVLIKNSIKKILYFNCIIITSFLLFTLFSYNNVTITNFSKKYSIQLTYFYTGDSTGSGKTLGSGLKASDFTADEKGWYHYNYNGQDYLVIAAALTKCRDSSKHCGVNVDEETGHGMASSIHYYNYYDVIKLDIGGTSYNAMVLDACGACMWGDRDKDGEKFDVFVVGSSAVNPSIYSVTLNGISGNVDGNVINDFKTTYSGDVKEGYIYKTQKNNALKVTEKTVTEKIDENINSIIESIFTTTGKYSDGKIGASAYTANVTYVNGSFKNKIAYYNQNDYKSYPYGNYGTIASHGCGTTSMAIVISSFLGREVSPVETTNWACSNGYCTSSGSSHSVIPGLAAQYGLNSTNEISSSSNLQPVVDALASGNSLVVVLAKSGEFTNSGHFLVLTGVDASGNISVADPASRKKTEKTYTLDFLINPTQGHIVKFWIISG